MVCSYLIVIFFKNNRRCFVFFFKKLVNNRSLTNLLYKMCQSNNILSLMKIYSQSDVCTSVHV